MKSRFVVSLVVGIISALATATAAVGEWRPHRVKQYDGRGGFVLLPARRNAITFPNGGPSSMRLFPLGLALMDNGKIAMAGALLDGEGETLTTSGMIYFSDDGGETWSERQTLPGGKRPMMFTYLGGGNLSYRVEAGSMRYFSSDYGKTWTETVPVPPLRCNGRRARGEGNTAVDRDADGNAVRVMEISFDWATGKHFPRDDCSAEFRYSLDGGRTWQDEISPPTWKYTVEYDGKKIVRGVGEGSVVRAGNGWLVAALRTDVPPRFWRYHYDNLMGTAISISKDNGRTWSPLRLLYDAGRHHANLQRLPNDDLVLTMIKRCDIDLGADEPKSHKRGLEALVSHDNGLTWNRDRRFVLDEFDYLDPAHWRYCMCGHLTSLALPDGSVLSAYGHHLDGSAVLVKWNPNAAPCQAATEQR